MDFRERFDHLNDNQQAAVKQIFGPLLVIAGPGTGKTELLSMRAAQILRETDTLPSNILCLTFTDSGAVNMRERLRDIIGEDAYKVAIHTFHSFGTEIINQHRDYFFRGSEFRPADELAQYQILRTLFDQLDWSHPLAVKNSETYTYLSDVRTVISEFKKSGLTPSELRDIVTANQSVMEQVSAKIADVFAGKITKTVIEPFAELARSVAELPSASLPAGISPYESTLALSIAHASQEALDSGKTNAITAWKNQWCDKDEQKNTILKDQKHADKLLATIDLYEAYVTAMNEAGLFDYDDMILGVIQSIEHNADLRANLQEQFQFIMVDEFQDTNLAQLRLLFSLSEHTSPNVMAVGDDDQAIFSFQGADIGNIQRFRERFDDLNIIVLTDNYRSSADILTAARSVITQGDDRLEHTIPDLSKELTPHFETEQSRVALCEYTSPGDERSAVARQISELIASGVPAENIAVLARRHFELIELLPHLTKQSVRVNYERRDNALDHPLVQLLEQLSRVLVALQKNDQDTVNALLPELIAQPAFGFSTKDIWKISLKAWRERMLWLEAMQTSTAFEPFASWLIERSIASTTEPLEAQLDTLVGTTEMGDDTTYTSPIHNYFFSPEKLTAQPDAYLDALESLRTIRDQLREHYATQTPTLSQLTMFIDLYRELGATLSVVRHRADHQVGHVNLMTAHKAKGLEFDHVFVLGAVDNAWGEKVRARSRIIRYPANLQLQPAGNTYDERLRLFFVAMTRAKKTLSISYSSSDTSGKPTLVASFLSSQPVEDQTSTSTIDTVTETAEIDWRGHLTQPLTDDLRSLLAPTLETYKLSATHLNTFLDVSRGGPQTFLLNNLLRFPQSKSPAANYGTAMHATLQRAHTAYRTEGTLPSEEELLAYFTEQLQEYHFSAEDLASFTDKGHVALRAFLTQKQDSFTQTQVTELSFAGQGVVIDQARLTGALDLADIDTTNKTIYVTDYKTGKPSRDWKGKTDYEKIKLHKYRQQLMFYQLLAQHSRDYSRYTFAGGKLQFVEPELRSGEILALEDHFSEEELADFRRLIDVVWQKITTLDLPDSSTYEPTYKGMVQFEQDLLDIK